MKLGARRGRGLILAVALLAPLFTASPTWAHPGDPDALEVADFMLHDIPLGQGVTDDVHIRLMTQPGHDCRHETVVAVHGAVSTGDTLLPFADALFARHHDARPCNFIALDLPGHGGSALPQGALFGDLGLPEFAAAVLGSLARLKDHGFDRITLVGHSMGGLVVQIAQQTLVDQGSSLRHAFDVRHVVLLAPATPQAVPCAFCQSPQVAAFLSQFIGFDPALGVRVQLPDAVWPSLPFTLPGGTIVADAPTPAEVATFGYDSPESFAAVTDLVGLSPAGRPNIDAGIFAPDFGTHLDIVSFENDTVVLPSEAEALHGYLLGNHDPSTFTVVHGADTVHGLPTSNPAEIFAAVQEQML